MMKPDRNPNLLIDTALVLFNLKIPHMKLKHMHKRASKNSLFRVVNELDSKIYPLGLKEEVKYVEDLNTALNRKYSKVEIANMLRRIMSYVILTNSSISATLPLAQKVVKTITEKDLMIVTGYILDNNQYIARLNYTLFQNKTEKSSK